MRFFIETAPLQYSLERQGLVPESVLKREKPANGSSAYLNAAVQCVINDIGNILSYDLRSQPGHANGRHLYDF